MPALRPFAFVGLVLLSHSWAASLAAAEPARPQSDSKSAVEALAAAPFSRPELIAIAWASGEVQPTGDPPSGKALKAWRPDGSPLPPEQLASIKKDLREFGSLGKAEPNRLAPLHLVFRIDGRAANSQRLVPRLVVGSGPVESLAVQEGSSANRLALSVLSLSRDSLPRWPAEIDVEISVPYEEGGVFKTLSDLKEEPVSVGPGAQLRWTKVATMDRSGQKILPAVLLEVDRAQATLVDYEFFTHLKDGTTHSFNSLQSNETHDVRVSPPLETKGDLDHIDLWRVRYRTELYHRLPIFPERNPG